MKKKAKKGWRKLKHPGPVCKEIVVRRYQRRKKNRLYVEICGLPSLWIYRFAFGRLSTHRCDGHKRQQEAVVRAVVKDLALRMKRWAGRGAAVAR